MIVPARLGELMLNATVPSMVSTMVRACKKRGGKKLTPIVNILYPEHSAHRPDNMILPLCGKYNARGISVNFGQREIMCLGSASPADKDKMVEKG